MRAIAYFAVARRRRIGRSGRKGKLHVAQTPSRNPGGPCPWTMQSNGEAIPPQEIPHEDPSRHRGKGSFAGAPFPNPEGRVQGDIAAAPEINRRSVMSYSIIGTGSVGST